MNISPLACLLLAALLLDVFIDSDDGGDVPPKRQLISKLINLMKLGLRVLPKVTIHTAIAEIKFVVSNMLHKAYQEAIPVTGLGGI
jgi:hypothetical protein